jgi:6-phosphogluconolactonase
MAVPGNNLTFPTRRSVFDANVHIYPHLEALSHAAAELFVEAAKLGIGQLGSFRGALSGGTTPQRLYELLGSSDYSDRIAWGNIHLFQVDERCVPPDHPESNFRMIREAMLEPGRVPRGIVHRIPGERPDPAEAASEYAIEIGRVIQPQAGTFPRFDLIFLGLGADGHTASLFPGSAVLEERTRWVCPSLPPQQGYGRITMTFPVLNAAAHVVFVVAGPEKAEILRTVLDGPCDANRLPVQAVQPANGRVSWYIDRGAASCLGRVGGSEQ